MLSGCERASAVCACEVSTKEWEFVYMYVHGNYR